MTTNHTLALLVSYAFAVCHAADWMCFALQMAIAAMVTSMNPSITARQNTGQDSEQVCASPKAPTLITYAQGTSLKSKEASMVTSQLIISYGGCCHQHWNLFLLALVHLQPCN